MGVPYKYGAKMTDAPDFFDCSGFIKYVFQEVNVEIPRSTIEQAEFAGRKVEENDMEIGDLIYARGSRGHYNPTFPEGIGHVGIYIGNDKVIHAASKRISDKPIIEKGGVVESTKEEFKEGWGPVITIKRVLNDNS